MHWRVIRAPCRVRLALTVLTRRAARACECTSPNVRTYRDRFTAFAVAFFSNATALVSRVDVSSQSFASNEREISFAFSPSSLVGLDRKPARFDKPLHNVAIEIFKTYAGYKIILRDEGRRLQRDKALEMFRRATSTLYRETRGNSQTRAIMYDAASVGGGGYSRVFLPSLVKKITARNASQPRPSPTSPSRK